MCEVFAQICSFEYADRHELIICFGQKGPEKHFFLNVQILNFTQNHARALVPSEIDS